MNRWSFFAVFSAALVAGGCVNRAAQMQAAQTAKIVNNPVKAVAVQPARLELVPKEIEITGELTTSEDTELGFKNSGRIVAMYVKDGDRVHAGQVLARQDTTQLQAQLSQAEAAVQGALSQYQGAQASLSQAIQNAKINPAKSTSAVRSAEAQLRSAKAMLAKAINGARPEDRATAAANVKSAKANFDSQQKELERTRTLVTEGAIPANRLDQQQATTEAARAQYEAALQAAATLTNGTRVEDVDAAKAAVQQAEQALVSAKEQKSLDSIYVDQVNGAKAQTATARAQIDVAREQLRQVQSSISDTELRAPFDGTVSGRPTQPGAVVGSGATVVHLIGGGGVYFEGEIPANSIGEIQLGKPVSISVSGFEGKVFTGHVAAINPLGESVGRLFKVRIQIDSQSAGLRPGMFARGEVKLGTVRGVAVPATAVVTDGGLHYVFIKEGDKARRIKVKLGLTEGLMVQVTGLPEGADVIVQGQNGLVDGTQVTTTTTVAATGALPKRG